MKTDEFAKLVAELDDSQKQKVLRLIKISLMRPETRGVIGDCGARGLDLDATLAELEKLSH